MIKYYNGKVSNIQATDSFDTAQLYESTLTIEDNQMLVKTGSPVKGDIKSSKIVTQVEIKDNKIKETKIKEDEKQ